MKEDGFRVGGIRQDGKRKTALSRWTRGQG